MTEESRQQPDIANHSNRFHKAGIAAIVGIAGTAATTLAAYNIFTAIYSSATATGSTAVSYISTWNCKKAHEILSQLTLHRLRDEGGGHGGHTENSEDLVVGTLNTTNSTISDFHTLRGSKEQALAVIKESFPQISTAAHNFNITSSSQSSGSHPTHSINSQHTESDPSTQHSKHPINSGSHNKTVNTVSKSTYLNNSSCEQLKHGVSPERVDVHMLSTQNALLFAQDLQQDDKWVSMIYGPWNSNKGKKYAFAIAKITPSYIQIGNNNRKLSSIMPDGAGTLKVSADATANTDIETRGQLLSLFPELTSENELQSIKLLPFRNATLSLISRADPNAVRWLATRSSSIVFIVGLALTTTIVCLTRKIEVNQKILQLSLERESKMDPLTRIANRRAWDEALDKAEDHRRKDGAMYTVIAIDLNDFKQINDNHGHMEGDNILKATADTLTNRTRDNDFVARVGGDEFAILTPIHDHRDIDELIARIDKDLVMKKIKASYGHSSTANKNTIYNTWHEADENMYIDKSRKKSLDNNYGFDPGQSS